LRFPCVELTNRIVAKEAEIIAPGEVGGVACSTSLPRRPKCRNLAFPHHCSRLLQEEHAARLEKVVGEKENMASHLENIREITDKKRENITKMAAQALALREKGSEYTVSSQIADSRTAYALSLYAKISNITWDYDAPTGKIAGCEWLRAERVGFE
jgi:hypothetical protein